MSGTSFLDKTDSVEEFAEAWAAGATRGDLAKEFGVSKWTITEWCKRDDVKAFAKKFIGDRALKVKRKADAKIEAMLDRDDLEVKDLILIRKTFAPDVPADAGMTDDELVAKAMEMLEENPDMAERMQREGVHVVD